MSKFVARKTDEEIIIHPGMKFARSGEIYLLALVYLPGTVARYTLVCLSSGNSWSDAGSLEEIAQQLNNNHFTLVQ